MSAIENILEGPCCDERFFRSHEASKVVLHSLYALDHDVGLLVDGHFCWLLDVFWLGVVGKEEKKRNSNEDAVYEPVPGAAHGLVWWLAACQRVAPLPLESPCAVRCPLTTRSLVGLFHRTTVEA